ncbi:MAG: 6-phosphogluconolactonase, partial [Candidatus Omnitrophota bacterium]
SLKAHNGATVEVLLRSRLIKMQTNITETVNESIFEEIGFLEGLGMKGRLPRQALYAEPNIKLIERLRNLNEGDIVIVGPGSYSSSILPHFMVDKLASTLEAARARGVKIVFMVNATVDNETNNLSVKDLIKSFDRVSKSFFEKIFTHIIVSRFDMLEVMPDLPARLDELERTMAEDFKTDELAPARVLAREIVLKVSQDPKGLSPYPMMRRFAQEVLGNETQYHIRELMAERNAPRLEEYIERLARLIAAVYARRSVEIRTDPNAPSEAAKRSVAPMVLTENDREWLRGMKIIEGSFITCTVAQKRRAGKYTTRVVQDAREIAGILRRILENGEEDLIAKSPEPQPDEPQDFFLRREGGPARGRRSLGVEPLSILLLAGGILEAASAHPFILAAVIGVGILAALWGIRAILRGIRKSSAHRRQNSPNQERNVKESLLNGQAESFDADTAMPGSDPVPVFLNTVNADILFVKGRERVVFPKAMLERLRHMVEIARDLRVELHAFCTIQDGVVTAVEYPDDRNKIAVLTADLPRETILNTTDYFVYPSGYFAALRSMFIKVFLSQGTVAPDDFRAIFSHFMKYVYHYRININFYLPAAGKRVFLRLENIENFGSQDLADALMHLQYIATEWIASMNLDQYEVQGKYVTEKPNPDHLDKSIIGIHNHPKDFPSPPSALHYAGKDIGDVYVPGFFSGTKSGLILDTPEGEEFFIFFEPDSSNKDKYHMMFRKFWNQNESVIQDLRKIGMQAFRLSGGSFDKGGPARGRRSLGVEPLSILLLAGGILEAASAHPLISSVSLVVVFAAAAIIALLVGAMLVFAAVRIWERFMTARPRHGPPEHEENSSEYSLDASPEGLRDAAKENTVLPWNNAVAFAALPLIGFSADSRNLLLVGIGMLIVIAALHFIRPFLSNRFRSAKELYQALVRSLFINYFEELDQQAERLEGIIALLVRVQSEAAVAKCPFTENFRELIARAQKFHRNIIWISRRGKDGIAEVSENWDEFKWPLTRFYLFLKAICLVPLVKWRLYRNSLDISRKVLFFTTAVQKTIGIFYLWRKAELKQTACEIEIEQGPGASSPLPESPASHIVSGQRRSSPDILVTSAEEFAVFGARRLAQEIRRLQGTLTRDVNIVFATGNTMIGMLECLSREEGIDWSRVQAFHLDEYRGISIRHKASFAWYLKKNLFDKVNIPVRNIHYMGDRPLLSVLLPWREKMTDIQAAADRPILNWLASAAEFVLNGFIGLIYFLRIDALLLKLYSRRLRKIGGADIAICGIGRDGHLAFDEPPCYSRFDSRIQIVKLDEQTIADNEPDYPEIRKNPYAYTLGMADIFAVPHVFLFANKAKKADIVEQALFGPITEDVPASMLQKHPQATVVLDEGAAGAAVRAELEWALAAESKLDVILEETVSDPEAEGMGAATVGKIARAIMDGRDKKRAHCDNGGREQSSRAVDAIVIGIGYAIGTIVLGLTAGWGWAVIPAGVALWNFAKTWDILQAFKSTDRGRDPPLTTPIASLKEKKIILHQAAKSLKFYNPILHELLHKFLNKLRLPGSLQEGIIHSVDFIGLIIPQKDIPSQMVPAAVRMMIVNAVLLGLKPFFINATYKKYAWAVVQTNYYFYAFIILGIFLLIYYKIKAAPDRQQFLPFGHKGWFSGIFGRFKELSSKEKWIVAMSVLFGQLLASPFDYWALAHNSPLATETIVKTSPIVIAIWTARFLIRNQKWKKVAKIIWPLIMSILGVVLVVTILKSLNTSGVRSVTTFGCLLASVSCFAYAASEIVKKETRQFKEKVNVIQLLFWSYLLSSLVMGAISRLFYNGFKFIISGEIAVIVSISLLTLLFSYKALDCFKKQHVYIPKIINNTSPIFVLFIPMVVPFQIFKTSRPAVFSSGWFLSIFGVVLVVAGVIFAILGSRAKGSSGWPEAKAAVEISSSPIRLETGHLFADTMGKDMYTSNDIEAVTGKLKRIKELFQEELELAKTGKGRMTLRRNWREWILPWIDPFMGNDVVIEDVMDVEKLLSENATLNKLIDTAERVREMKTEAWVHIGIGGSIIPTRALVNPTISFYHNDLSLEQRGGAPKVYYTGDNFSGKKNYDMLEALKAQGILFKAIYNVISKSGTTQETIGAYLLIRDYLEKEMKKIGDEYKAKKVTDAELKEMGLTKEDFVGGIKTERFFIFTTGFDEKGSALYQLHREGLREEEKADPYAGKFFAVLPVPEGTGGRFTALTPVGLLLLAVTANNKKGETPTSRITEVMAGARQAIDIMLKLEAEDEQNIAFANAAISHIAEHKKGKSIEVFYMYDPVFSDMGWWLNELYSESLQEFGRGINTKPLLGPQDNHMDWNGIMAGPRDKIIRFFMTEEYDEQENLQVPDRSGIANPNVASIEGFRLGRVENISCRATAAAATDPTRKDKQGQVIDRLPGVLNYIQILPKNTLSNLGQMF